MARPAHAVEFKNGLVISKGHWVLGGQLPAYPDVRATRIADVRDGKWAHLADLPEIVASFERVRGTSSHIVYAMLRNGVTHSWRDGKHNVEIIDDTRHLFFSELRVIGGAIFACGAGLQVFRKRGGAWTPIDAGLFINPAADRETARLATRTILTSLDGVAENDIYAVGTGGIIVRFDGRQWTRIRSPTNLGLTRVRCHGGAIYACGFHGLLLRGGPEGWRVLSQLYGAPPLIDLASFGGRLYAASEFGLHVLEGDVLVDVTHGISKADYGGLAPGDTELLSIGGETILAFDGTTWRLVECPWNREA